MRTLELTWSSPLPPTRSGVADYADELLPHLVAHATVTVVQPPGGDPTVSWRGKVRFIAHGAPPRGVELLHLGNNPYHLWVAARLRRFGGVVVLHDAVLHHLLVEEAAATGDWRRFREELATAAGKAGEALAGARRWGFFSPLDPFLFPARPAYLRFARAVIVHNRRALEAVRAELPGVPVAQVPLAVGALSGGNGGKLRRRLGIDERELLAVHLGFLTPAKGLSTILLALAVAAELGVAVRLLVVGEGAEQERLAASVREAGLGERVVLFGYAKREELADILDAADVGLVPRFPTAGETSAAVLRFLGSGRPVVVCGYQQFLEFPADVALRIRPGREGAVELARWLAYLGRHPEVLGEKKRAARTVWEDGGHEPSAAARRLLAAVQQLAEGLAQSRGPGEAHVV